MQIKRNRKNDNEQGTGIGEIADFDRDVRRSLGTNGIIICIHILMNNEIL